jgi:hypothetical protein
MSNSDSYSFDSVLATSIGNLLFPASTLTRANGSDGLEA